MDRISSIKNNMLGIESPDDLMLKIIEVLPETGTIPEAGNYYTFVYKPKTPGVKYDEFPLVAVTDVFQWGFKGLNFHWRQSRNYTWEELAGQLYIVDYDELDDLLRFPYGKFITK